MKKFSAYVTLILLIAAAAVAVGCPVFGADLPYMDVPRGSWYENDVAFCDERDLMNGTGPTTFSPNATTTRAMIVTILYRIAVDPTEKPETYKAHGFSDVPANAYYADAVRWGVTYDIVKGVDKTHFGPNRPVTREQAVALFYRTAITWSWKLDNGFHQPWDNADRADIRQFADIGKVGSYAAIPFSWSAANGIITGIKSGNKMNLSPKGNASRAQIAAIVTRFVKHIAMIDKPLFIAKDVEKEVVRLVNIERQKAGVPPLTMSDELSQVARAKATDFHESNYFDHTSPVYGDPGKMLDSFNVSCYAWGENIAGGFGSAQDVVTAWMNSEGHKKNILNSNFKKIGVGYNLYGPFWVQVFTD